MNIRDKNQISIDCKQLQTSEPRRCGARCRFSYIKVTVGKLWLLTWENVRHIFNLVKIVKLMYTICKKFNREKGDLGEVFFSIALIISKHTRVFLIIELCGWAWAHGYLPFSLCLYRWCIFAQGWCFGSRTLIITLERLLSLK